MLYEADLLARSEYITINPAYPYIQAIKLVSFSIYSFDLLLRISAKLGSFFSNLYGWIDVIVLIDYMLVWIITQTFPYFSTYTGLRILRGLQMMRIFRLIPLIPSLELVVNALLLTMATSVLDVIYLTLMAVFVLGTRSLTSRRIRPLLFWHEQHNISSIS